MQRGWLVEDFGGTVLGRPIIVDALNDHNKPAEAPGLATQAYDAGADLLMDVQNSPIALAVAKVANDRHKLAISTGSAAPALPAAPAAATSTTIRSTCPRLKPQPPAILLRRRMARRLGFHFGR